MPVTFNDAKFDMVLAHMRDGDDMFRAAKREGYYVRDLFSYIHNCRSGDGVDLHPLLYLVRADWLTTRAEALATDLADGAVSQRIRSRRIAAEWRQAADRLLCEARALREQALMLSL